MTWGGVRAEVGQVLNWAGSKVGLGLGLRLGRGWVGLRSNWIGAGLGWAGLTPRTFVEAGEPVLQHGQLVDAAELLEQRLEVLLVQAPRNLPHEELDGVVVLHGHSGTRVQPAHADAAVRGAESQARAGAGGRRRPSGCRGHVPAPSALPRVPRPACPAVPPRTAGEGLGEGAGPGCKGGGLLGGRGPAESEGRGRLERGVVEGGAPESGWSLPRSSLGSRPSALNPAPSPSSPPPQPSDVRHLAGPVYASDLHNE